MASNKPKLELSGEDGNAFFIIGRAIKVARKAGWSQEKIDEFKDKAISGDYNNFLKVCIEYFEVK